jgi:hypothetical protein
LVKATDMAGKAVPAWALERVVAVVEGLGVIVGAVLVTENEAGPETPAVEAVTV